MSYVKWNPLIVAVLEERGFVFVRDFGAAVMVDGDTHYSHPKIPAFHVKTAKPVSRYSPVNPNKFILYVDGMRYKTRLGRHRYQPLVTRKLIDCGHPRWEAQLVTWWTYATFKKLEIDRTYAEADTKAEQDRRLREDAEEALKRAATEAGLTDDDVQSARLRVYSDPATTHLQVGRVFSSGASPLGTIDPAGLAKALRLAAFLKAEGWK